MSSWAHRVLQLSLYATLFATSTSTGNLLADSQDNIDFNIDAQLLADALDEFSRQSNIQILYQSEQMPQRQTTALQARQNAEATLNSLLSDTGLTWTFVNDNTIAIRKPRTRLQRVFDTLTQQQAVPAPDTSTAALEPFDMLVTFLRVPLPGTDFSNAGFGLEKRLFELPRSIYQVSPQIMNTADVNVVDDLLRLSPGVYTPARFGIQGAIDIRNSPADVYFRGMRRVTLEGHGPGLLAPTDTIEIVRGPASPLYGMGKPGGYTNVDPLSVRSRAGTYQTVPRGFVELKHGSYDKAEASVGVGGPMQLAGRRGGYYGYALLEHSGSYVRHVDVDNQVLQFAVSVDDALGDYRLESGFYYQSSRTAGALINRATQGLVDSGAYISGLPLLNLDLDGSGSIGFLEMHQASPASGSLAAGNQPLIQVWRWPLDTSGAPLPLAQFPRIAGIPQNLYHYLQANPAADPQGLLRAQGAGGPLPMSGAVPLGFALDPRTVAINPVDHRAPGAFERELTAKFGIFYLDFIKDVNPDRIIRNQFFVDVMDQYKVSEQPGGGKQDVTVVEDRLSASISNIKLSDNKSLSLMAAANLRFTEARGFRYGGDQGSHRIDMTREESRTAANSRFTHAFDNPIVANGGAPWVRDYRSRYWEAGLGILADMALSDSSNVLLGTRLDYSEAQNKDFAGTSNTNSGTSGNPGTLRTQDVLTKGADAGAAWSISLTQKLPGNLLAYGTASQSTLLLDNNNNSLSNEVIQLGHIGQAQLHEAGIRAYHPERGLSMNIAYFQQQRTDSQGDEITAAAQTYLASTQTFGWEAELSWQAAANWLFSSFMTRHTTYFQPNKSDLVLVNARTLGFMDVVDPQGNVVFPAEAFLYGGRSFIELPAAISAYRQRQAYPELQAGFMLAWQTPGQWEISLFGNYFSKVHSGRLKTIELPSASIFSLGITRQFGPWQYQLNVGNIFDKKGYRARSRDNLGETLLSAVPGRQWRTSLIRSF
jgi:iron complex outermembrane receptor protein